MATASSREADSIYSIDYVDPVEPVDVRDLVDSVDPVDPVETGDVQASPGADLNEPSRDESSGVPAGVGEAYVTVWRSDVPDDVDDRDDTDDGPVVAAEYATAPGMPARGVILLSLVACVLCALVDCGLTGTLTMFFDLCFVTACLVGAMSIRREDLFTAGVLAPLVFAAVVLLVTIGVGDAFVVGGSMSKGFFTGLAAHAGALVAGYGVALAVVGGRVASARSALA